MENRYIIEEKRPYDKILEQIENDSELMYDAVGWLRDSANEPEKVHANKLRGLLREVNNELYKWRRTAYQQQRNNMKL